MTGTPPLLDPETVLTELCVLVDDWCKTQAPLPRAGPAPALAEREVLTLVLFGQGAQFPAERAFYRYAARHVRSLFPTLPSRPQFNRQLRGVQERLTRFALPRGQQLAGLATRAYESSDGTGVPTRTAKRRGAGWVPQLADSGKWTRRGWSESIRLRLRVIPQGAITGFGLGPASTHDRALAETFLILRAQAAPPLSSIGPPVSGWYVADMGFAGVECAERWATCYGATVVWPAQTGRARAQHWSKAWRTWLTRHRQVIETVNDRLLRTCGLARERPHDLTGVPARLAAKVGLPNVWLWFNHQPGRPPLAVADLLDW